MKKQPVATVVNFCSNERRFLQATLQQATLFSRQVIVPVCDHFFDGTLENRALLEQIYAAFPDCLFIEYPYIPHKIPKSVWKKIDPAHFWHSFSRWLATHFLDEEIESVLFLDADEVPDGKRFAEWLDCSDYMHHTALKLANYWYFREACHQALRFEDSVILVQKRALEKEIVLHPEERDAIYNLLPGPKRRHVTGSDGAPMFHHYSWVRTEEEMLKKVGSWGHKGDREWVSLVREEFATPFRGIDFVHGYSYQSVKPFVDISWGEVPFLSKGTPKVRKIGEEEVVKLVKGRKIWNFLDF